MILWMILTMPQLSKINNIKHQISKTNKMTEAMKEEVGQAQQQNKFK